jgi:hypothetical protein
MRQGALRTIAAALARAEATLRADGKRVTRAALARLTGLSERAIKQYQSDSGMPDGAGGGYFSDRGSARESRRLDARLARDRDPAG